MKDTRTYVSTYIPIIRGFCYLVYPFSIYVLYRMYVALRRDIVGHVRETYQIDHDLDHLQIEHLDSNGPL